MRRYETISIVDPDISEEDRTGLLERIGDLIPKYDGFLVNQDEWGIKKLSYEVKKKTRGYYILFDFCGSGELVDELERFFRIDDRVIKYMTVVLDKFADLDKIKEELAAADADVQAAESEDTTDSEESTEQKESSVENVDSEEDKNPVTKEEE